MSSFFVDYRALQTAMFKLRSGYVKLLNNRSVLNRGKKMVSILENVKSIEQLLRQLQRNFTRNQQVKTILVRFIRVCRGCCESKPYLHSYARKVLKDIGIFSNNYNFLLESILYGLMSCPSMPFQ